MITTVILCGKRRLEVRSRQVCMSDVNLDTTDYASDYIS